MEFTFKFILLTIIYCVKAVYTPVGYLGCFDDSKDKHLHIQIQTSDTNSGDECKDRCGQKGYRFAGTKAANQCHCGTKLLNNQRGNGCTLECTGRVDESCGGSVHISIYDTWQCVKEPCGNNTIECVDRSATEYFCRCRDGWTGQNCSQELPSISTIATTTTSVKASTYIPLMTSPQTTVRNKTLHTFMSSQTKQVPPISTSSLETTTTEMASNESTQKETPVEASTSIRIPVSTLSTLSVSNNSVPRLTTSKTKQDSTQIWLIIAVVGIIVVLIVAIVAFFVGRQRGRRAMMNPISQSETAPQVTVYNELDVIQRSSNMYSELDENETAYITPCTFMTIETTNDYAYIDEET